ncbi:MAG: CAAD domain-containing protein [Cyanobacteria bacterium P01_D01_bin.105]
MATEFQTEDPVTTNGTPNSTTDTTTSETPSETMEQVKRVTAQVVDNLGELPKYFGEFFQEYRRPLLALGLIFGAFISVKLTLAILDAINDVPVLAPLFELIGLIYSGWFIYRYLLKASNRSELASEMNALKDQILGRT